MRGITGKHCHYLMVVLSGILMSGCSSDFEGMAEKRLEFARQNTGDIYIAAIQDEPNSHYINGILLAAKDINQRPGKLLGRSVNITVLQDGDNFELAKPVIRSIVANPKIVAVLGHRRSSVAVPASVIYERSQVVFLASFSTAQSLTGHNFKYVFRMAPSNDVMTEQMANVADMLGYRRMVVLYARDDLSRELAFLFEDSAVNRGIKLVKGSSFLGQGGNYRPIISQFNSEQFDAVFIAASGAAAGRMASQLREMGVDQPIIGSDSLNSSAYNEAAGPAANKTIVPSIYSPDTRNFTVRRFTDAYEVSYQTRPDFNAAQGYDSLMLLAEAIERSGSTLPPLIQSTLHFMPAWVGLTGLHKYDQDGELDGKKYFFRARQDDKWTDLSAIQVPYLIERFQERKAETDFKEVFSQRIHDDDHKVQLLALAQEALGFRKIGIIYEDTEVGRKVSGYDLLSQLKGMKGIEIVDCNIAFSLLDAQEVKKLMTSCYGKLSLSVDAILAPPPYIVPDAGHLKRLNKSLIFFKTPIISLEPDNDDPNITLTLGKRSDIDLKSNEIVQAYNGLINGMKTRQFSELLQNFPEISVNLINLQKYGFADKPILDLSPDRYLIPDYTEDNQSGGSQ
jgi:ABC-type branched-subunit amino acid transport system substrate-binding protein